MAGDDTGCPERLEACDFSYPSIYHGTTVGAEIEAHAETLTCAANDASYCGIFDCETATGAILTLIGNRVGWAREHCNVRPVDFFGLQCDVPPPVGTGCIEPSVVGLCDGAGFYCRLNETVNYEFTDDELYRSFVKAAIIKNRARRFKELESVKLIDEITKALWGDEAWVVTADNNTITVSAGRDLTAEEIEILSLYQRVLCAGLGMELQIFCVAPDKPIGCNRNPGFIKNTISCVGASFDNLNCALIADPDGDTVTLTITNVPAGVTVTDAGGGAVVVNGLPTTPEPWTFDVSANDGNGGTSSQTITLTCTQIVNSIPVAATFPDSSHDFGAAEAYDLSTCFTDADGDTLTYAVVSPATLPSGVTFNVNSGILSFDGTVAAGDYDFEIIANDGTANSAASCDFTITVSSANPIDLPNCPAFQTFSNGDPIAGLQVGTGMTVTGLPNGLIYNSANGLISGSPTGAGSGAITVTNANGANCSFGYQFTGMEV